MKIFISHSTKSNFVDELYTPLQNSELDQKHELVLPHAANGEPQEEGQTAPIKDIIRDCDLVVAECSDPTFEQGLELGWASGAYVTTVCFYKNGAQPSASLSQISDNVNSYGSIDELIKKVMEAADAL